MNSQDAATVSVAVASLSAELLTLPLNKPLEEWSAPPVLPAPARGVSRHVVRFVCLSGTVLAVKELPDALVRREHRLLSHLAEQSVPVVQSVATVVNRPGLDGDGLLITRYLDFSLPYRLLFGSDIPEAMLDRLLDAMAELLVRLHLVGLFWGDCSLSNTLFRRDAGALAAYLVDAETAELHKPLTDGQRHYDLELATERIAGELMDVAAEAAESGNTASAAAQDPLAIGEQVDKRYGALWAEITREEIVDPHDERSIASRLARINDLGFDVAEMELVPDVGGSRLRLRTAVVEPGHHRRAMAGLTGLDVQENQARRLLNDIHSFRAHLAAKHRADLSPEAAAARWLDEVYRPTLESVPPPLRNKLEEPELFHQILDHRWFLSEDRGRDVGMREATRSFIDTVLPHLPDEQRFAGLTPSGGETPLPHQVRP